jgi:hypothetical protein
MAPGSNMDKTAYEGPIGYNYDFVIRYL